MVFRAFVWKENGKISALALLRRGTKFAVRPRDRVRVIHLNLFLSISYPHLNPLPVKQGEEIIFTYFTSLVSCKKLRSA